MYTTRNRFPLLNSIAIVLFVCAIGFIGQAPPVTATSHNSPQLTPSHIVKWDPAGGAGHTYTVDISASDTKVIAVVVLSNPGFTPRIEIDSDAGCIVSNAERRAAVSYCSDGQSGNYVITVKKSNGNDPDAAYAVMALNTNNASGGATVTGTQGGAGRTLSPNRLDMFNIKNKSNLIQKRTLRLNAEKKVSNANPTTNLVFAVMFREDGAVSCSSWGNITCDVFDNNNDDYHLLVFNADNVDIISTLRLES